MKKRVLFICLIGVFVLLFGIKLNNLIIGNKILGQYSSIDYPVLNIKPLKRNVNCLECTPYLTFSFAGTRFHMPKLDSFKSFKIRQRYGAIYFRDSSSFKVINDSIKVDFLKILTSANHSDSYIIADYLRRKKITTNFDLLLLTYNKTPDDLSFFNLSKENTVIQYTFLKLKDMAVMSGGDKAITYFALTNIKGFEYGIPEVRNRIWVQVFTKRKDEYLLIFQDFNQEQIDCVINSIDSSLQ